jgi:DNA-binding HxlR family transcriptional regulator
LIFKVEEMENCLEKYRTNENCPVRNVLDRFGDKWSILVIMILGEGGVMRFKDLNAAIDDISQKMLTVTLRKLESDGLVTRTVYPEIPPRVEYGLTEVGESLLPHIRGLADWALQNLEAIEHSRKEYQS